MFGNNVARISIASGGIMEAIVDKIDLCICTDLCTYVYNFTCLCG